jgi:hypothetical protein
MLSYGGEEYMRKQSCPKINTKQVQPELNIGVQ